MATNRNGQAFQNVSVPLLRRPLAWLSVAVLVLAVNSYAVADQGQAAQIAALEARVAKLEKRIATAEHEVVAPFQVVDSSGKRILGVGQQSTNGIRGIYISNSNGGIVFEAKAALGGSVLTLQNDESKSQIALGATEANEPAIKIRTDSKMRAIVASSADGHGRIAVYGQDGAQLASGLESQPDWKGRVAVYTKGSLPVALLAESEKHPGGGSVIATDPDGNKVFAAGFIGDGNGTACAVKNGSGNCLGTILPGLFGVPVR
jgi:hypothetical protein